MLADVAVEQLPRGRKSKVKIREIPFWVFFWVFSKESKAKMAEFSGQFLVLSSRPKSADQ